MPPRSLLPGHPTQLIAALERATTGPAMQQVLATLRAVEGGDETSADGTRLSRWSAELVAAHAGYLSRRVLQALLRRTEAQSLLTLLVRNPAIDTPAVRTTALGWIELVLTFPGPARLSDTHRRTVRLAEHLGTSLVAAGHVSLDGPTMTALAAPGTDQGRPSEAQRAAAQSILLTHPELDPLPFIKPDLSSRAVQLVAWHPMATSAHWRLLARRCTAGVSTILRVPNALAHADVVHELVAVSLSASQWQSVTTWSTVERLIPIANAADAAQLFRYALRRYRRELEATVTPEFPESWRALPRQAFLPLLANEVPETLRERIALGLSTLHRRDRTAAAAAPPRA